MTDIAGLLLAGGQARRMGGGDKCLRPLAGKPLLDRVIERVAPQCARLMLNANGDPARFVRYQLPIIPDIVPGHAGPLAGIVSGLCWLRQHAPATEYMLGVPTDAPFLPDDLAARLMEPIAAGRAPLTCAMSGGRAHPVVGIWPVRLADNLLRALNDEGLRKVDEWTARHGLETVTWPVVPVDPFFNANKPDDLALAERMIGENPSTGSSHPNDRGK